VELRLYVAFRLSYIQMLRKQYNRQFDQGMLGRDALHVLTEALARLQDEIERLQVGW
jgi:hypothetical protein